jgi:hypothetical protein
LIILKWRKGGYRQLKPPAAWLVEILYGAEYANFFEQRHRIFQARPVAGAKKANPASGRVWQKAT